MSNIVRTDPFRELTRFDPFGSFESLAPWPRFRRWMQELPQEPAIRLEVSEDEKSYRVKAELPGVKKEDIEVKVEGNQVSLSAEVKRATEEKKGETIVHSERYYGKQLRSFTLDHDIDRNNTKAKFENGVLEITLPKGCGSVTPAIKVD